MTSSRFGRLMMNKDKVVDIFPRQSTSLFFPSLLRYTSSYIPLYCVGYLILYTSIHIYEQILTAAAVLGIMCFNTVT